MPYKKQTTVHLTDDVWGAASERAVWEETTVSEICERLLRHYLNLEEKPSRYGLPEGTPVGKRTVRVSPDVWAEVKLQKVKEGRPVSAILEQLLRAYLGLPMFDDEESEGAA